MKNYQRTIFIYIYIILLSFLISCAATNSKKFPTYPKPTNADYNAMDWEQSDVDSFIESWTTKWFNNTDSDDTEYDNIDDSSGYIESRPKLISRKMPKYPKFAAEHSVEGQVFVELLIDRNGDVIIATIEKDSTRIWVPKYVYEKSDSFHKKIRKDFNHESIKVARKTKFSPALLNSKPISVWITYLIEFKLR